MRRLLLLAMLLFPVASWAGECVVVTSGFQSALPRIQINVWREGKPASNVIVQLIPLGKSVISSISADSKGIANFSKLEPGNYLFLAAPATKEEAELYVTVQGGASQSGESFFSINLVDKMPFSAAQLGAAEKLPVESTIARFVGEALDVTGAGIPKVDVWIIPQGLRDFSQVTWLRADTEGHFSTTLPDGRYTVVVQGQGFRTRSTGVEIRKDQESRKLTITLQVGSC